ncbi:MAG TPA: hypothetical protein VFY93_12635 [Planctomycetota bacterium]|nr:hypothetical protein [Planctomycetota bacterium]
MLAKCVCSNCSHSYLGDDQSGNLACPRCGTENTGVPNVPTYEAAAPASGRDEMILDPHYGQGLDLQFAPLSPPAMFVTGDRLLRALLGGGAIAALVGAIVGGAQAAVQVAIPGLSAIALGLAGGAAFRFGLGGRSAGRTLGRTGFVLALMLVLGFAGVVAGAWAVERYTVTADRDGDGRADVAQTREDLDKGLRELLRIRSRTQDAGQAAVLDHRITETEELKHLSDAQLEDYLWTQKAGFNQPLVAYGKSRVTEGPAVKLTPQSRPMELPENAVPGILIGEFLVAFALAIRAVTPR